MALTGSSGVDKLHVLLEPGQEPDGVFGWLGRWLKPAGNGASKDIRLDVQSTASTTYLLNAAGQGIVSTIDIVHTQR